MLSWIVRALRGRMDVPGSRVELTRTFTYAWKRRARFLFWDRTREIRVTILVRALPIEELLANDIALRRLGARLGDRLSDAVVVATVLRDARVFDLPQRAHLELWEAYAELNQLPKAPAPASSGASASSSSASDSSAGPSASVAPASSP